MEPADAGCYGWGFLAKGRGRATGNGGAVTSPRRLPSNPDSSATDVLTHCPRTRRNRVPGPHGIRIELVGTGSPTFSQVAVGPRMVACCT